MKGKFMYILPHDAVGLRKLMKSKICTLLALRNPHLTTSRKLLCRKK